MSKPTELDILRSTIRKLAEQRHRFIEEKGRFFKVNGDKNIIGLSESLEKLGCCGYAPSEDDMEKDAISELADKIDSDVILPGSRPLHLYSLSCHHLDYRVRELIGAFQMPCDNPKKEEKRTHPAMFPALPGNLLQNSSKDPLALLNDHAGDVNSPFNWVTIPGPLVSQTSDCRTISFDNGPALIGISCVRDCPIKLYTVGVSSRKAWFDLIANNGDKNRVIPDVNDPDYPIIYLKKGQVIITQVMSIIHVLAPDGNDDPTGLLKFTFWGPPPIHLSEREESCFELMMVYNILSRGNAISDLPVGEIPQYLNIDSAEMDEDAHDYNLKMPSIKDFAARKTGKLFHLYQSFSHPIFLSKYSVKDDTDWKFSLYMLRTFGNHFTTIVNHVSALEKGYKLAQSVPDDLEFILDDNPIFTSYQLRSAKTDASGVYKQLRIHKARGSKSYKESVEKLNLVADNWKSTKLEGVLRHAKSIKEGLDNIIPHITDASVRDKVNAEFKLLSKFTKTNKSKLRKLILKWDKALKNGTIVAEATKSNKRKANSEKKKTPPSSHAKKQKGNIWDRQDASQWVETHITAVWQKDFESLLNRLEICKGSEISPDDPNYITHYESTDDTVKRFTRSLNQLTEFKDATTEMDQFDSSDITKYFQRIDAIMKENPSPTSILSVPPPPVLPNMVPNPVSSLPDICINRANGSCPSQTGYLISKQQSATLAEEGLCGDNILCLPCFWKDIVLDLKQACCKIVDDLNDQKFARIFLTTKGGFSDDEFSENDIDDLVKEQKTTARKTARRIQKKFTSLCNNPVVQDDDGNYVPNKSALKSISKITVAAQELCEMFEDVAEECEKGPHNSDVDPMDEEESFHDSHEEDSIDDPVVPQAPLWKDGTVLLAAKGMIHSLGLLMPQSGPVRDAFDDFSHVWNAERRGVISQSCQTVYDPRKWYAVEIDDSNPFKIICEGFNKMQLENTMQEKYHDLGLEEGSDYKIVEGHKLNEKL